MEQSINNHQKIHSAESTWQQQNESTSNRRDDTKRLSDAELLLDFSRRASFSFANGSNQAIRKPSTELKPGIVSPDSALPLVPYDSAAIVNGSASAHTSDRTFCQPFTNVNTRDTSRLEQSALGISLSAANTPSTAQAPSPKRPLSNAQVDSPQYIQRVAQAMIENSERIARSLKARINEEQFSSFSKHWGSQETKHQGESASKPFHAQRSMNLEDINCVHQSSKMRTPLQGMQPYLRWSGDGIPQIPNAFRRSNSASRSADGEDDVETIKHYHSIPSQEQMEVDASSVTMRPVLERVHTVDEGTKCAGCDISPNSFSGEYVDWLQCNGCKQWFHLACAGFTAKEVKKVDKFYCTSCQPKFGRTTFVRKSGRAHTAVDYAGLNEGVWRTSDEMVEHHYIKPIKEGSMKILPETFPRMAPEEVTADYFEKCGSMCEPIIIPANLNPRPDFPIARSDLEQDTQPASVDPFDAEDVQDSPYTQEVVPNLGQDKLGMVIPRGLTVRQVAELYGQHMPIEVIDVKSQEGDSSKKWTVGKWADYYEATGEKIIRNVISLEVSKSLLGRLIRRPTVVRDLDLQDAVWPASDEKRTSVGFYCLMSVADSYTDFHIDFAGSSVYYHILRGKKTFFFIPPTNKNLKKYEEWCLNKAMNSIWLPDLTKECYRVDLSPGDTMLIPSGWIHSVWTPEDSLVIGGNFLTRLHYSMQLRVVEIERTCKVPLKYRYPFFQKVMWYTMIKYLEVDPLPESVRLHFYAGNKFYRSKQPYLELDKYGPGSDAGEENYQARYYSKQELSGLPDFVSYIFRSLMIHLDRLDGVTQETRKAVSRSIPKNKGDPLEIARTFAIWVAWKHGNEDIPTWAHPNGPLEIKEEDIPTSETAAEKKAEAPRKITAAEMKKWERLAPVKGYQLSLYQPVSQLLSFADTVGDQDELMIDVNSGTAPKTSILGPKRTACDICRKRKMRCKHVLDSPPVSRTAAGVVVDKQPNTKVRTMLAPGPNGAGVMVAGVMLSPEHIGRQRDSSVTATVGPPVENCATPTSDGKKGRNKACPECRRSKVRTLSVIVFQCDDQNTNAAAQRRCIHDENGNIDPIKQNEPVVPRGSASKKRKSSGSENSEMSEKKIKVDHTDDSSMMDDLSLLNPLLQEQEHANDEPAEPLQPNTPGWIAPCANGASDSSEYQSAIELAVESADDGILQSTESADQDAMDHGEEVEHHSNGIADGEPEALTVVAKTSPNTVADEKSAAETATSLDGGTDIANGLTNGAAHPSTSRTSSVLVSPTNSSAPMLNGTVDTNVSPSPASRRQSSRASKPVDRFLPVKAATSPNHAVPSPAPRRSTSQKASLPNGQTSSPESTIVVAVSPPRAAKTRAASAKASPGRAAPGAKQRARSVGAKNAARTPVRKDARPDDAKGKGRSAERKVETEEEASLRLAMAMQAQEFGLRRRSSVWSKEG